MLPTMFLDSHVPAITSLANFVNRGPHVKPMPVSQPSPATLATHRQWKPIDIMLRWSAVCTIVAGESTSIVTTSTPLSASRSEEHTSELQSRQYLVCRLLLEKKKKKHLRHLHKDNHEHLLNHVTSSA